MPQPTHRWLQFTGLFFVTLKSPLGTLTSKIPLGQAKASGDVRGDYLGSRSGCLSLHLKDMADCSHTHRLYEDLDATGPPPHPQNRLYEDLDATGAPPIPNYKSAI